VKKVKFETDAELKEKIQAEEEALKTYAQSEDTFRKRKGSFDIKSAKLLDGASSKSNVSVYTICFTGGPCAGRIQAI
jgi:hypothetical protein